jgi:hypothetical protein
VLCSPCHDQHESQRRGKHICAKRDHRYEHRLGHRDEQRHRLPAFVERQLGFRVQSEAFRLSEERHATSLGKLGQALSSKSGPHDPATRSSPPVLRSALFPVIPRIPYYLSDDARPYPPSIPCSPPDHCQGVVVLRQQCLAD